MRLTKILTWKFRKVEKYILLKKSKQFYCSLSYIKYCCVQKVTSLHKINPYYNMLLPLSLPLSFKLSYKCLLLFVTWWFFFLTSATSASRPSSFPSPDSSPRYSNEIKMANTCLWSCLDWNFWMMTLISSLKKL